MPGIFGPNYYMDNSKNIKPQIFIKGPRWDNNLQADIYEVSLLPFRDAEEAKQAAEKMVKWWESTGIFDEECNSNS